MTYHSYSLFDVAISASLAIAATLGRNLRSCKEYVHVYIVTMGMRVSEPAVLPRPNYGRASTTMAKAEQEPRQLIAAGLVRFILIPTLYNVVNM